MVSHPLILTPHARAALFDPPREHDEVQRRYGLTPEDIALAKRHRRAHNRLGFAVQLALVHDLGRPLRAKEELPAAVIEVIADQLGIAPAVFEVYAQRNATRREHVGEIVTHLRLRTIQQSDYRTAILAAAAFAVGTEKGEAIVRAILDDLKARRILVPVGQPRRAVCARRPPGRGGRRTATSCGISTRRHANSSKPC